MDTRATLKHRIAQLRAEGWTDEQVNALLIRLRREATRIRLAAQSAPAGDLAAATDHRSIQTPTLRLVDEGLEWALSTPDARLTTPVSPQQGKSTRCAVWAPI